MDPKELVTDSQQEVIIENGISDNLILVEDYEWYPDSAI